MKHKFHILLSASLCLVPTITAASNIEHGKTLQQQHCMSCHDDGMYTRDDRRITTLEGLRNQVGRCELTLELQWFDDDVNAVTDYLNESFYRF